MNDRGPDAGHRQLDVRPLLAAGEEPLETILAAARDIPIGGTLTVIAPFEPRPLYRVLGLRGFAHRAEVLNGDDVAAHFSQTGITAASLVREVRERYPATRSVFAAFAIDLCCGGEKSLATVAAAHGIDLAELLERTLAAVDA